jgi:hypothetical protein
MSKKIVFKIDNEGGVNIASVEGYGSSCLEATQAVEKALGNISPGSRKMTSEYDQSTTETTNHLRSNAE